MPPAGKQIDWARLVMDDARRRQRVKQLIAQKSLTTGEDFHRAAMILQHGQGAADYLLAHDLAVIALIKGDSGARWLAAATLDRYLRAIGMAQRFGTQSIGSPGKPPQLAFRRQSLLAELLQREGKAAEAVQAWQQAVAMAEAQYGSDTISTARHRVPLAEVLLEAGRPAQAREQVRRAAPLLREQLVPESELPLRLARLESRLGAG